MIKMLVDLMYFFWKGGVYYARRKGVKVGSKCRIYTKKFGSEPFLISIGNNVTVTDGVTFLTHDGSTCLIEDEKGRRFLYRAIDIMDNVFIGVNSIIMPGVKIESNVIVAAGSVITKSIPEGKIVGGNPAKIIGDFSKYKKKVLETYVSRQDLNKDLDYKKMVDKVMDKSFKEFL